MPENTAQLTRHGIALVLTADPTSSRVVIAHPELDNRDIVVTTDPVAGWRIRAPAPQLPAVHVINCDTVFDYAALFFKLELEQNEALRQEQIAITDGVQALIASAHSAGGPAAA